jgi:2-polyprenyl-6-hydroxyphenyl methylase / 3-demethylubiquinone-9 3-methyltransferase
MTLRVDPEQNEVRALKAVTDWKNKRVLEIGCGDGRLTLRLARLGAIVEANDPKPEAITKARKNLPKRFAGKVRHKVGQAERLAYRDASFDAVVFAWSL